MPSRFVALIMYLQKISILNFRNLESVSLGFQKGFWIVLGSNGQGKSNLLEAISVLCFGRSRRASNDREMIRAYEKWFSLDGKFVREERGQLENSVRITPEGKKELVVFGAQVGRIARFMAEASCVGFSSEDVQIILGEPTLRRQFLNEAVSQTSQGYLHDLSRYRRVLEQKNRALKSVRERQAPPDSLDVWDTQLADYGGRVCARRERYIRQLSETAARLYERISDSAEKLEIVYDPNVPRPESMEQWPGVMAEMLASRRQDEIVRGISLVGPQRDDIIVRIGGMEARTYASRGQARTAALALRLGQAHLVYEITREWPIILMDDVFAELDPNRRKMLAEAASQAEQVFATAAAESDLPDLGQKLAGKVCVKKGLITVEKSEDEAQR